jgi:UDP-GlcNAc:undecaprenyl-phosphate GlcNAc-1-phosphate transferase
VVWALIDAAGSQRSMDPVTALWLVAIPLVDTLGVMGRRMMQGRSPFSADRAHMHHLLTRISGHPRKTLNLMLSVAVALAAVGMLGQIHQVDPPAMFVAGVAVFVLYVIFLGYAQRLHRRALRLRRPLLAEEQA